MSLFCLSHTSACTILAYPRSYPSPIIWSLGLTVSLIQILYLLIIEHVRAEYILTFHCTLGHVDLIGHVSHPCGCKPQKGKIYNSSNSGRGMIKFALSLSTDLRNIRHKIPVLTALHFVQWLLTKFFPCSNSEHIQLLISYKKFPLYLNRLGRKQSFTSGPKGFRWCPRWYLPTEVGTCFSPSVFK